MERGEREGGKERERRGNQMTFKVFPVPRIWLLP